jgi:putative Holliday junction resolvase
MNNGPATVLGFDFGRKRIGIAVGQTLTASARPLETVRVRDDGPDWDAIGHIVDSWRPERLIVGLPTQLDDSEHPLAAAVHGFAAALRQRYALPVELVDERLSSHEAAQIAVAAGGRTAPHRQSAKETLDRIAAQVILETWLAEQSTNRQPS